MYININGLEGDLALALTNRKQCRNNKLDCICNLKGTKRGTRIVTDLAKGSFPSVVL